VGARRGRHAQHHLVDGGRLQAPREARLQTAGRPRVLRSGGRRSPRKARRPVDDRERARSGARGLLHHRVRRDAVSDPDGRRTEAAGHGGRERDVLVHDPRARNPRPCEHAASHRQRTRHRRRSGQADRRLPAEDRDPRRVARVRRAHAVPRGHGGGAARPRRVPTAEREPAGRPRAHAQRVHAHHVRPDDHARRHEVRCPATRATTCARSSRKRSATCSTR